MKDNIHSIIRELFAKREASIKEWFFVQYQSIQPLFYTSVDIRDSGAKVAPIDTNVFPAGFNNISPIKHEYAAKQVDSYLQRFEYNRNVLIITENHSRNEFYIKNIEILKKIISLTGRVVHSSIIDDVENNNGVISSDQFTPDVIILNNDLSSGVPKNLQSASQSILPSTKFGWYNRNKSFHSHKYSEVLADFCNEFNLDEFLLQAVSYNCGEINFQESQGLECIAKQADKILSILKEKYAFYNIDDKPYIYIKADKGTYGMGIMTISDPDEIFVLNRKSRKKMHITKDGVTNTEVVVQEGIKTSVEYRQDSDHPVLVAEPLVYLVGGKPIDCFLRINSQRSSEENLNKQGAKFVPFNPGINTYSHLNSYSLVASLATLAASKEL